jgi:hypothetical protein
MDLTRLYNLTTPELREEAERLGVSDTYAMSRGQLIHAIRNQGDGPAAEGLLGKVLGFAKWALKAAQEEPVEAESAAVSVREPVSEPVPVPVPVSAPVSAAAAAAATEPVSAAATEPESASGPPSRPPAGVFSKSAGRFEEPFPTRTMARILAEQGHFKRSLAIYGALLRDEPGNRDLSAEAEEVRTQSRARRSLVH